MTAERAVKLIALNFVSFMHYVATMLAFFIPIDVAHYYFGVSQFSSILIGSCFLWLWSSVTGWIILKTIDPEGDNGKVGI